MILDFDFRDYDSWDACCYFGANGTIECKDCKVRLKVKIMHPKSKVVTNCGWYYERMEHVHKFKKDIF